MVYIRDKWPIGHPKILYRPKRRRARRLPKGQSESAKAFLLCYVQQTNIILLPKDIWPICSRDTLPRHLIPFQSCMELSMFKFAFFVFYVSSFRLVVCVYTFLYNEYRIAWCLLFILHKRGQNPNASIILARSNIRFIGRFVGSWIHNSCYQI